MNPLFDEPAISLVVRKQEDPGIEVRVNFGVFAGRYATPAEIDELAIALQATLPSFAIVSEVRHEFADAVEASVHQVVVEVPQESASEEGELLAQKIVFIANGWALECIASRHGAGEL
jgi:hypothetical protein